MITPTLSKAEFDSLSIKEKRIAICKDVIARIDGENIVPCHGVFWPNKVPNAYDMSFAEEKEYKEEITVKDRINGEPCKVCAKGALFCSWVGNFNEVSWSAANQSNMEEIAKLNTAAPELVTIFGRVMLDNIEAAFEKQAYRWHYDRLETLKYAVAFDGYTLRDIMQYIIDNNGTFPLPTE